MKILIIGGGLFGTSVASVLADKNNTVDIVESQDELLQLASKVNHNRIHLGYHYLRSIQTAEQSIEGLLSFLFNYGEAVVYQFPNYYAIAKEGSKTSPDEFIRFCENVGIGYDEEFPDNTLFDQDKILASFKVPEPIWDYDILKSVIKKKLSKANVNLYLNTECIGLKQLDDGTFEAKFYTGVKYYDAVINASYANINKINSYLNIEPKKLLYEDVLIPLFNYPSPQFGLTIMDGPFCSVMPNGIKNNEFLLYHVKESIIQSQLSTIRPSFKQSDYSPEDLTAKNGIYTKSAQYLPFLKNVIPNGYRRTLRTVYENSDDARITELHTFDNVKNYFSILSGKVTTCIQVALEIKHILAGKKINKRYKI